MQKPKSNEYKVSFEKYMVYVQDGDILIQLNQNTKYISECFLTIPESKHLYRYAQGKWTPKDILMHLIDTERAMSFRALVAGRGDVETPLNSVDENLYAANVDVSARSMTDLVEEFNLVRQSNLKLFQNLNDEQSKFIGDPERNPISARAVVCLFIGHSLHHVQILKERYF